MICTCGHVNVGAVVTGNRNWDPDCPDHGVLSDWYQSPEVQQRLQDQAAKTRILQARARAARKCTNHFGVDCPNCQQGDF